MAGSKTLYISQDGKIYTVPKPKYPSTIYKPIAELANQNVLVISLVYTLEKRQIKHIDFITFNRITLSEQGTYDFTIRREDDPRIYNMKHFDITFNDNAIQRLVEAEPTPLPLAYVRPTEKEMSILVKYLVERAKLQEVESIKAALDVYLKMAEKNEDMCKAVLKTAMKQKSRYK